MRDCGIELSVGESVRVHNRVLTILDICGDEITFRIERIDDPDATEPEGSELNFLPEFAAGLPPR